MTTKFRIPWAQLGWEAEDPAPAPALFGPAAGGQGPVAFLVIAPWCPDCREIAPGLPRELPGGRPVWLVGEFAPRAEVQAFAREYGITWPLLFGQARKSEAARNVARFRQVREALGDRRHWGVPLWIQGRLVNGWLEVDEVTYPA